LKVKLAKTAGFCMGVKRAMNIVLDAANKKKGEIYTCGPLVHNPQAVEMLKQKGVEVLSSDSVSNATVIIRAHGIPPGERRKIKEAGNLVCDATCPHVARAQAIIKQHINKGYGVIIVGDKGHAEVNGLLGFANNNGHVIENVADAQNLPRIDKACVLAQTTQDRKVFLEIVDNLENRIPDLKIFDTICDSTSMRQKEVEELANEVDAMVIVGGKNSANTRRLYEISASTGTASFHIEGEEELDHLGLERYENIGVMSGASTPNWVINKVIDRIHYLLKKSKTGLYRLLQSIGDFMVESTLYLSIGAVSMCYTSLVFQGIRLSATLLSISFLYVFATHVFNRYKERIKDEFTDPARTRFFQDYGKVLVAAATVSSFISLYLSYRLGLIPFFFLMFSYLMGMIYGLRIVPRRLQPYIKYKRLKDFPGSRDFLVSLAWTWVIVMIPFLSQETYHPYLALMMLIFVFLSVFIRSVVFDIVSIEGDRIVGRETIPILLGRKKTQRLLIMLSIILGSLMFFSSAFGLVSSLGYYLSLFPVFMVACLYVFQKRRVLAGKSFEALIDSSFIFAGIITYLWQAA
jgi:4-hydroxy-3-methylbut-2-enyl diphosphate reductase